MSSRLRLGAGDLLRIRVSLVPDPVWELQSAAHWPLPTDDPLLGGWARRVEETLGEDARPLARRLRSPLVQVVDLGYRPDAEGAPFDQALGAILSQPAARWRALTEQLRSLGFTAAAEAAGDRRTRDRLAVDLSRFHRAAVAPGWPQLMGVASAAAQGWIRTMAERGIGALLRGLHPGIRWTPPVLTVVQTERCAAGCCHARLPGSGGPPHLRPVSPGGLVIIPSVHARNAIVQLDAEPAVPEVTAVVVPVPHRRAAISGTSGEPSPLAALMGRTRAAVLLACAAGEPTTSELGRAVGVSVASASEHASVLREAGLIRSRRDGPAVRHTATPSGYSLVLG